jgi:hypothetical protein
MVLLVMAGSFCFWLVRFALLVAALLLPCCCLVAALLLVGYGFRWFWLVRFALFLITIAIIIDFFSVVIVAAMISRHLFCCSGKKLINSN